ncbi:hypothetical protein [Oceanobacter mangrovi]|uniref:hypothetical protein n=1 Tax=Oceanobacter mangrovi TaxID=2862510 RepID=UPI001C8F0328|nr:hypothetical protein [Oceanobacter mangrovi]
MVTTAKLRVRCWFMTLLLSLLTAPVFAASAPKETEKAPPEPEYKIYELEFETDSNWTSVEIRDDAVFVNAPVGSAMNITAKDGLRSFTISPQKIHIRSRTRGLVNLNLYVKSRNNVLGMTICKGSRSSYAWIRSEQSKQKNDVQEQDHCETAALVLNLF